MLASVAATLAHVSLLAVITTQGLNTMSQTTALRTTNGQVPAERVENPWADIAAERGSQTRLVFKKGKWSVNDEPVDEGTKYIAFIDQLCRGYIKFNGDGQAPDLRIRLVTAGQIKRHELGDVDESERPLDNGKPKDPWLECWQLPLMPVDALGELVVFATSSVGGAGAVADLCGIYSRSPRHGMLPIIEIRTSSYFNKKTRDDVFVPVLKLVSWHRTEPDPVPVSGGASENPADGFNDEVAF